MLISLFFAFAVAKAEIVAISYQEVVRCLPQFSDAQQKRKIDLSRLKVAIDHAHPSTESYLHSRVVEYRDVKDQMYRLSQVRQSAKAYQQKIEIKDSKGQWQLNQQGTAWTAQELQKKLVGTKILLDESTLFDTKLNKGQMRWKRAQGVITEIEFKLGATGKVLRCDTDKQRVVTCVCN